jgi:hypothetical protein
MTLRLSDMENRIAELKHDLVAEARRAADDSCLQEFSATEGAFLVILLLQRARGISPRCRIASPLRCPRNRSSAGLYSIAHANVWFSIRRLLEAASNAASRCWKSLSLRQLNFAEVTSSACTLNSKTGKSSE